MFEQKMFNDWLQCFTEVCTQMALNNEKIKEKESKEK